MIVTDDGRAIGTIGGGLLEARVLQKARGVLSSGTPEMIHFDMTHSDVASMDMICGGRLDVLLEAIRPGSIAAAVIEFRCNAGCSSEPSLFLTMIRTSGGTVETIRHGVLQGRRVVCGDLDLAPGTLAAVLRDCGRMAGLRTAAVGDATLLIEPITPAATVFVFGAGHVAVPTARLAKMVGFRVCVVDDRGEFATAERFPEADDIRVVGDFGAALEGLALDRSAYVVIVTRGHLHDRTVLVQALRTEAAYIGMIGSRRKRDAIFGSLLEEGFSGTELQRVHSPIGLDIGAESCEEIAVSIVAELVRTRARMRAA